MAFETNSPGDGFHTWIMVELGLDTREKYKNRFASQEMKFAGKQSAHGAEQRLSRGKGFVGSFHFSRDCITALEFQRPLFLSIQI